MKENLIRILEEVIGEDYRDMFPKESTPNEKLRLLTSESMLALYFITTIEDELSIEFDDDDIDLAFFDSFELLAVKIEKMCK